MVPVLGLMNEPRPLPQQNAPAPTALPTGLPTAPSSSRAPAPPTVRTMLMAPVARAQPEARSAASVSPVPAAPTGSGEPAWDSLPPSAAPQPVHAPAGRTQPMPPMTARVSMVAPKPWTAVPTTTPSPRSESESALESAVTSVSAAQAAAALVATPQPRPMPPKPPARKSEPPAVVALRNAEPDPREAALEQLQNQLVETMERARAQESRAHDAEERAARAEAQLSATASGPHPDVEELRVKLVTATERFHQSELQLVEAERRAQSSEELVRLAKQRLADASAQADEDTVVQKQKSFGLGAVLGGVGLCLLTTGLGGYYGAVSPLQKQVAAQQQQHQLESEQQARALVTLQSQRDGERRSLETEAQELRSKLQAALTESLNATETADASRGGRPARAARRVAAEPTEAADSNTRSARAIAHRYRRARAEAQADGESTGGGEAENSRPARASRAEARPAEDSSARTPRAAQHANDDSDPLGGL